MVLRGNRALVAVIVVAAQMAVFCFFGAMSIIIPLIASEVRVWRVCISPLGLCHVLVR